MSGFAALGIISQPTTPSPAIQTKPQYAKDVDPFADVLPTATPLKKEEEKKSPDEP